MRDAYFDRRSRVRLVRSWTDIFGTESLVESIRGKKLAEKLLQHHVVDETESNLTELLQSNDAANAGTAETARSSRPAWRRPSSSGWGSR